MQEQPTRAGSGRSQWPHLQQLRGIGESDGGSFLTLLVLVISIDLALQTLLTDFPQVRHIEELRRNLGAQGNAQSAIREWGTWQQNWDARIKPLVEEGFQLATDAFLEQIAQRHRQAQRATRSAVI